MSTALRLVFRTLLVAAAAAVGMAAAVEGGPPPAQAGAASAESGVALFPPEGAEWHVELNCEDGRYLMALFLDALSDLWAERLLPTAEGPPEACARAADAPVFVTIYPVDQPLLRVMGRGSNLAESVLDAARRGGMRAFFPAGKPLRRTAARRASRPPAAAGPPRLQCETMRTGEAAGFHFAAPGGGRGGRFAQREPPHCGPPRWGPGNRDR